MPAQSKPAVLFVDDEPGIRELAEVALVSAGYAVATAEDGVQAIERLEEAAFDVAVVDIIMPIKDGTETIVDIRKRWPAMPIIAMSGGGRIAPDDFLDLASHLGAALVLKKPFRLSELLALIADALATDRTPAQPTVA